MAEAAKAKFEKERSDVLKALPDELKDTFGTIGFCPGEEDDDDDDNNNNEANTNASPQAPYMQPVLIVSPYDVPPKPVRDIYWMDAFTKAKRSKAKLKKLDYLVYVYGSDDPDDCYNFVSHDEFVSLEEGKTNGFDIVPPALASKKESERTESESKLVRAIEEMKADLTKKPGDRKHGEPFLEGYEKLKAKEEGVVSSPPPSKKQKT
eukprot:CAMPEP_0201121332 /NCGR_PEP_ID=MMETSP0850-20130426/5230_1 /ASSEMBLY_ACC=CAM_ASM_000622 /TAXON_ID=183588 /ORGANISM="Pseudo-nitzschia fraudulenta, Strain WWA7" /LENGTH=206 /DNA_ID=CAMNT_0047387743 /DNA_START=151 /DNA_END=771 /DNA_ORIENTATION=+